MAWTHLTCVTWKSLTRSFMANFEFAILFMLTWDSVSSVLRKQPFAFDMESMSNLWTMVWHGMTWNDMTDMEWHGKTRKPDHCWHGMTWDDEIISPIDMEWHGKPAPLKSGGASSSPEPFPPSPLHFKLRSELQLQSLQASLKALSVILNPKS